MKTTDPLLYLRVTLKAFFLPPWDLLTLWAPFDTDPGNSYRLSPWFCQSFFQNQARPLWHHTCSSLCLESKGDAMTRSIHPKLCFEPAEYEKPKKIKTLQIETPLHDLKGEDFRPLSSLEELILVPSFNEYRESSEWPDFIPPDLFRELRSLKKLKILGKNIKALPSDCFRGLENLIQLDLGGNLISEIRPNALRGLNKLTSLAISHNGLSEIRSTYFEPLTQLTWLDLSGNRIRSLELSCFQNLQNLMSLNLSHNRISNLDSMVFAGLDKLNALNLKGNPLGRVNASSFNLLDKTAVIFADKKLGERTVTA